MFESRQSSDGSNLSKVAKRLANLLRVHRNLLYLSHRNGGDLLFLRLDIFATSKTAAAHFWSPIQTGALQHWACVCRNNQRRTTIHEPDSRAMRPRFCARARRL